MTGCSLQCAVCILQSVSASEADRGRIVEGKTFGICVLTGGFGCGDGAEVECCEKSPFFMRSCVHGGRRPRWTCTLRGCRPSPCTFLSSTRTLLLEELVVVVVVLLLLLSVAEGGVGAPAHRECSYSLAEWPAICVAAVGRARRGR